MLLLPYNRKVSNIFQIVFLKLLLFLPLKKLTLYVFSCKIDRYHADQTTLFGKYCLIKEHWIFKLGKNNFD